MKPVKNPVPAYLFPKVGDMLIRRSDGERFTVASINPCRRRAEGKPCIQDGDCNYCLLLTIRETPCGNHCWADFAGQPWWTIAPN